MNSLLGFIPIFWAVIIFIFNEWFAYRWGIWYPRQWNPPYYEKWGIQKAITFTKIVSLFLFVLGVLILSNSFESIPVISQIIVAFFFLVLFLATALIPNSPSKK